MDEIRKAVPVVAAKEVVLTKEVATVSLNPDGKINLALDKAVFLESIRNTLDAGLNTQECDRCSYCERCGWNMPAFNLADIRTLYDKGILTTRDFTTTQLKAIQSIRV